MLPLELLLAHMVGDYIFQNDWMANNKFTNSWARLLHCAIYTTVFLPIIICYGPLDFWTQVLCFGLLFGSHTIIDSWRWTLGSTWPPKAILVDQTLHLAILVIVGNILL